ncbi:glycosyltransferase, partial [Georgenia ruanii]|nr:glycosyltransferase [Georgenia ruanii]
VDLGTWGLVYSATVVLIVGTVWLVQRGRPGFGRRTGIVVPLVAAGVYLTWRVLFTIPRDTAWDTALGILLVAVELIGFAQAVAFAAVTWEPAAAAPVPLSALDRLPSVDIFIATYDEPVGTLRTTVAAAAGVRYPGRVTVYLCDDGGRAEVRDLAETFGARYLARTDHAHAKAGNLNHALAHSDGEIVVTLDADMAPRAEFLERTVGQFRDRQLGFVQAPQAFYNEDPFQFNLFSGKALPNEQDFFMRTLQAGKARFNAVMYVGSNALFRRTALEDIGGFATGVLTEDMATGMVLQAAKYRAAFVPDVIAAGLAPESFPDLLKQRDRWSRGNIQSARRWNPLTLRGLTPMQRWLYADGVVYWFFGLFKLVYLLTPLAYLVLGVSAVHASLTTLAVFWLPYFVSSMLSFSMVSDGRRSFVWSHVYEIAMAPAIAVATLSELVGLRVRTFAVTPKGAVRRQRTFDWRVVWPHLALIALSLYGLVHVTVFAPERYGTTALVISVFWTLYNLAGLVMAVLLCVERPRLRGAERTRVDHPMTALFPDLPAVPGRLVDLSVTGARFVLPWSGSFGPERFLDAPRRPETVDIPGIGTIRGQSRWVADVAGAMMVGFEFSGLDPARTVALVRTITASPGWVRDDHEDRAGMGGAAARALSGTLRGATESRRAEVRVDTRATARLHPLVARPSAPSAAHDRSGRHADLSAMPTFVREQRAYVGIVEEVSFGGCRVLTDQRLEPGALFSVSIEGHLHTAEVAQVRWARRRLKGYVAGLQFGRSEARVEAR